MASRIAAAAGVLAALLACSGCGVFGSATASSGASASGLGPEETGGIGVNAFLWRATLDTLSFMPLASADPWGGVIITDWYANPELPGERFKATVYILDTRLRADGVSAAVFKEVSTDGAWVSSAVSPETNIALENAILSKARDLRMSALD